MSHSRLTRVVARYLVNRANGFQPAPRGELESKRECVGLTQSGSSKHGRPRDCIGEALSEIPLFL